MYIIKKLHVLLPLVVSVVLCFFGIHYGYNLQELSFKLVLSIIIFYLIGSYLRNYLLNFLLKVLRENERKAELIEKYELEKRKNTAKALLEQDIEEFEPYVPDNLEQ